ncbi:fructose-6-phosphate aldolase [Helcococcus ovis]|uniref:fructose-6-phosphate aldolase n=1 Tax=Helcococcus ovis TaxID=72026 RepID=UPI00106FD11A|nr:fructose-6-phosphate aldolase [Helcococcus ovis]TFF68763.1 fructose-6-phosphate aldolase [Helcococcus ovis]WNZ01219.1 fructose-6-phosphate aldolase [Helcococcus ovis]
MKFFVDTANIEKIKEINNLGLCDGVTTNPTLVAKEKRNFEEIIKEICSIVAGPVSAEVTSLKSEDMVKEAKNIAKWSNNVVIKIPITEEGLKAINILSKEGINTNCTLIFSAAQGLLAMKAGATYISPFLGRIDDMGELGIGLIKDLREIIDNYKFKSKIIAASIRTIAHVKDSAIAGADIATIPADLFPKLWKHVLTDKGLIDFLNDWEKYKEELNK